jgi:DNA-binding GntR family transcriptional regulator
MSDDAAAPAVKRPTSLAQYVRDVLAEDIRTGRVTSGDHLAEEHIMRRTGVSRTPVREGVRLLQSEGLVAVSRNRGARVVRALTRAEVMSVYACRLATEPPMAAMAAERLTEDEIDRLGALVDRFERSLRSNSTEEIAAVDAEFHERICQASDSPLLGVFRSYWSKLQIDLTRQVYSGETPRLFHEEHVGILAALRGREAAVAEQRMRDHIEHGRSVLERAYAAEGD